MDDATGAFADINGLRLYYEIHGSGRPLVLLHGDLQTIDLMFGPMLPTLRRTVR
jgi:pimeloyl-ACP methyl ester carboxylesterase